MNTTPSGQQPDGDQPAWLRAFTLFSHSLFFIAVAVMVGAAIIVPIREHRKNNTAAEPAAVTCEWRWVFTIADDVTCDDVSDTARQVLIESGLFGLRPLNREIEFEASRVCSICQGDQVEVFGRNQKHIVGLHATLIGDFCPGNRNNLIFID